MEVEVLQEFGLRVRVLVGLIGLALLAGCHKGGSAAKSAVQHYAVRGTVVSVNVQNGGIDLDAETIPGFMEAMTMSYKVVDPAVLGEVHKGDKITATLLCDGDAAGCAEMRLVDVVVVAQAKPDYLPAMNYHVPVAGDVVPDFVLLNQSGKKIRLGQFKGKVLVMTFVYTRCPLADYCPRMSRNFAEMDRDLSADKKLYAGTHLLTVSFDPAYDTPKVLKSYGEAYTGKFTEATFGHWDFAAPDVKEMKEMEEWFSLGVTPGDNGTLQHSLSTLVIGKDGKVAAFYPTKDWDVKDVEAVVKKAVE